MLYIKTDIVEKKKTFTERQILFIHRLPLLKIFHAEIALFSVQRVACPQGESSNLAPFLPTNETLQVITIIFFQTFLCAESFEFLLLEIVLPPHEGLLTFQT
jgi:hypothetical protein